MSDVVEGLAISRAKVYELMANGELPSVRLAGSRRIREVDLRLFVANLDCGLPTWGARD